MNQIGEFGSKPDTSKKRISKYKYKSTKNIPLKHTEKTKEENIKNRMREI